MVRIIEGDLFDTDCDVIAHQVNCMGEMKSGVAKTIRELYPKVYRAYKKELKEWDWNYCLGTAQLVKTDNKIIINLFSQESYGYDKKRYTNYEAFYTCLESMNRQLPLDKSIAMPFKIGCDRGGADWEIIYTMIKNVFESRAVYLYKLGE